MSDFEAEVRPGRYGGELYCVQCPKSAAKFITSCAVTALSLGWNPIPKSTVGVPLLATTGSMSAALRARALAA